jgi:DNA (cytosine-5)-methyltransferase 1
VLTVGSLFSGIGGFDLGLERAGMRVLWQCEADEFCRRVLARHWPDVPCGPDVRGVGRRTVAPVDLICGGFPCQDISVAGRGAGIDGERSGLWSEYARVVSELRPRYVVVENVPALLGRGLGRVLGDLAALGYDAEWDCLPASAFGAPHRRDRIWIVAYPGCGSLQLGREPGELASARPGARSTPRPQGLSAAAGHRSEDVANPPARVAHAGGSRLEGAGHGAAAPDRVREDDPWAAEPDVGRVAHGVPHRVDRLRALGNALVPQIAEWIGRRIVTWELSPKPEGDA